MRPAAGATPETDLLRTVLPGVSRSFALSLRILPAALRAPLGITYLLARAADTIADTRALPPAERLGHLAALRAAIRAPEAAAPTAPPVAAGLPEPERRLVARLADVLTAYRAFPAADRARAQTVLLTLTQAMVDVLERFPSEAEGRVGALESPADLDRYTYMNAGCVGEFWTDTVVAHRPTCAARFNVALMRARGARYGQGLQLTNVLRDFPRDLRIGRCYLPRQALAALGVVPEELRDPKTLGRIRPLVAGLVGEAVRDLEDGLLYTLAVPRRELRLRLACAWPLLIGLATLARIARADDLLDPDVVVKVPRAETRRLLGISTILAPSNRALRAYAGGLRRAIRL